MTGKIGPVPILAVSVATVCALQSLVKAGPPFLTDDPDPVPLHHWEAYGFVTSDQSANGRTTLGPALELNNGVAPNTQLHLIVPLAYFSQNGSVERGLGDIEAGVKYRFVQETKDRPEIGVFPLAELATGDGSRSLGNGRTWFKLPVWLQKSKGAWTTYGGAGYAYNTAPGQRDYFYGGQLLQRTINARWTLGGEVFVQGAQVESSAGLAAITPGARSACLWNLGGQYNFRPDLSLLFSGGHSFHGERHSIMYLALYHTWGPESAPR